MPNPEETSRVGAKTAGVTYESAGPYTEEHDQQFAKEALGDGAADEPLQQGSLGDKDATDTQGTNPKRKENSRAD